MSKQTLGWARRHIERGFAPIPVPARSKNPNREGWQNERHGLRDVDRVWSNGQGIKLLCRLFSRCASYLRGQKRRQT